MIMNTNIQLFKNEKFSEIRVIENLTHIAGFSCENEKKRVKNHYF